LFRASYFINVDMGGVCVEISGAPNSNERRCSIKESQAHEGYVSVFFFLNRLPCASGMSAYIQCSVHILSTVLRKRERNSYEKGVTGSTHARGRAQPEFFVVSENMIVNYSSQQPQVTTSSRSTTFWGISKTLSHIFAAKHRRCDYQITYPNDDWHIALYDASSY